MPNPHPFYRFSPAWNTGFYPQNQIASNQLNDIYVQIDAWLPGYWSGKTIDQLFYAVKQEIKPYNEFPVLGNFTARITKIFDIPNYEFFIRIQDDDLLKLDGNQYINITGYFNPISNLVTSASVDVFTVGSYSGTFDSVFVPAEQTAIDALDVVNDYGSAIFPMFYSYDSTLGIATSYLARASSLQLSNGDISRIPADTLPNLNARRFTLSALTAEDKYAITLLERAMMSSIGATTVTPIQDEYNSWDLTEGPSVGTMVKWFASSAGTYLRVQINIQSINDRIFTLVGQYNDGWIWQRFVNDLGVDTNNSFLTTYSSSTLLPYEPNSGSRYIYLNTFYDFDLVDFESDCYVSPEFYAMPGIPGDTLQFNVPIDSGNLTGLDSVNVGLFEEDGGLVQKIGTATLESRCCCNQYVFERTYNAVELDFIRSQINSNIGPGGWSYYFFISNGTDVIQYESQPMPGTYIDTPSQLNDYFAQFGSPFIFSVNITGDDWETATGTMTITTVSMNCDEETLYMNEQIANEFNPITPYASSEFTITAGGCDYIPNTQFYASCTIPAVSDGCYRLGLYGDPSSTCDMTFTFTLEGTDLTDYLNAVNSSFGGLNPYVSFGLASYVYVYNVVSDATTAEDIANWCNANIPGMAVVAGEGTLSFTWQLELGCDSTYLMQSCQSDESGVSCLLTLWQTPIQECVCGTSYYLYSLSNIVNIDRSDCFSTILEFWGEDNSIAQGFEYQNGWKQRVRIGLNGGGEKPVLEESLYRQSNGVHRRPQNKQDLSIDLHTDFFDLDTQLAMTDATRHPYLVWNNQGIFVKGDIDVATIQDFTTQTSFETLSQMKFQALKQGFQPRNSSCLTC